jgi:LL-H family phage holin
MNPTYLELLLAVIPIVITVLLGWVSPYVVKFLDAKIGHNNAVALENFARVAVAAAEQQVKNGSNSDKKAVALAALNAFVGDHKYSASEANLDALIEAAVYQLKQWGTPITLAGSGDTSVAVSTGEAQTAVRVVDAAVPATGETPVPVVPAD